MAKRLVMTPSAPNPALRRWDRGSVQCLVSRMKANHGRRVPRIAEHPEDLATPASKGRCLAREPHWRPASGESLKLEDPGRIPRRRDAEELGVFAAELGRPLVFNLESAEVTLALHSSSARACNSHQGVMRERPLGWATRVAKKTNMKAPIDMELR